MSSCPSLTGEIRDDVVRIARNRDDGVTVEQIAADFGVHPMTMTKWTRQPTSATAPSPEPAPPILLLEQENEVLRRAVATCRSPINGTQDRQATPQMRTDDSARRPSVSHCTATDPQSHRPPTLGIRDTRCETGNETPRPAVMRWAVVGVGVSFV